MRCSVYKDAFDAIYRIWLLEDVYSIFCLSQRLRVVWNKSLKVPTGNDNMMNGHTSKVTFV